MNVLVTGASGFIGRKLCEELTRDGVCVTAMVRKLIEESLWDNLIIHDLNDPINLLSLTNIDTVFHLAGKAHALSEVKQDEDEYFQVNTEATKRLLEASKRQGVKKFIYFSSVKAVGDIDGVMDESLSLKPDTPYGRSKQAAETLVLEGGYVPHPVVIRPSMVYGNTIKGNLPNMIQMIRAGKFPPLPDVKNKRSMVHVEDVVQAAMLAAENPKAAHQIYIVTDGEQYSTREMYEWICEALDQPVPTWTLPFMLLKMMAKTGDVIGRLRGRRFLFDSDVLQKLMGSACYSSAKIERELGFKAHRRLREALPEIVRYLEISR